MWADIVVMTDPLARIPDEGFCGGERSAAHSVPVAEQRCGAIRGIEEKSAVNSVLVTGSFRIAHLVAPSPGLLIKPCGASIPDTRRAVPKSH